MAKKIVNLTLLIVQEEINFLFQVYPYSRYQQVFTNPDLCKELIVYVLNHVPNHYRVVDDEKEEQAIIAEMYPSIEEKMNIESAAHEGISIILKQNLEWLGFDMSEYSVTPEQPATARGENPPLSLSY